MLTNAVSIVVAATMATTSVESDRHLGTFVCRVEVAVGIVEKNKSASGIAKIPEEDRAFGLSVHYASSDNGRRAKCAQYFDLIAETLPSDELAERAHLSNAEDAARSCVVRYDAQIAGAVGAYTSVDGVSFESTIPLGFNAFRLWGNGHFQRVSPYDEGPVLTSGKCQRIPGQ